MKRTLQLIPLIFLVLVIVGFFVMRKPTPKQKYTPKVTYTFSGGRFGDNLLAYMRAKWICYKYDLPLAYKPFPFSDDLGLDAQEKEVFHPENFENEIFYTNSLALQNKQRSKKTAYVIPYFPESTNEIKLTEDWQYFQVDWKDPVFRKKILSLLTLPKTLNSPDIAPHFAKVAVHVRTGRGYDSETAWKDAPLKFPPMNYYAKQLHTMSTMIDKDKPLYVRVFTDDPDPEMIANQLKNQAGVERAEFHVVAPEKTGVLEDFFEMMQYDYMIRAESNISIAASLLHDFQVTCFPSHFLFENGLVHIDQVKWVINQ